jgi:thiol-disulfide isomerase/thioredoxin
MPQEWLLNKRIGKMVKSTFYSFKTIYASIVLLYLLTLMVYSFDHSKSSHMQNQSSLDQKGRVRAPELKGDKGWLNTSEPLSLAALRGKVVLLDFWTYGCINCIHIIPDLKRLEAKYANQLVVIGVHSAKFTNERETENIRRIILRYEIEHPVVNDAEFKIWKSYAVRAWPTQVLIDPAGYIVGSVSGEGNYRAIDQAIAETIEQFRKRGELKEEPLRLSLERAKVGDLPLAFPGKVLADEINNRLFIADSNHNRIVITDLEGKLIDVIGNGRVGLTDGSYEKASFNRPQGMAIGGNLLYVADTENHLIRAIDLKRRNVTTIAGTGEQLFLNIRRGNAKETALNSPWDLALVGQSLYIAMAGQHQIWKLELDKKEVGVFAGSGREARIDGTLLQSAFAQPSGLATDGKRLFVADSESNIIRSIDLLKGEVKTLIGGDLFEFGDIDGEGDTVRLQHPLGLVLSKGALLIADTYNHKIKRLNPNARTITSLLGTGKPGQKDGSSPSFYEPGGLSIAKDSLYIADTNNHAIRVVDLKRSKTSTLMIKGLLPPTSETIYSLDTSIEPNTDKDISLPVQQFPIAKDGALVIDVGLPEGYHLNPFAPNSYSIKVEKGKEQIELKELSGKVNAKKGFPFTIPLQLRSAGSYQLKVELNIYYCREDNTGTCHIKMLTWYVPVEGVDNVALSNQIKLRGEVKEP